MNRLTKVSSSSRWFACSTRTRIAVVVGACAAASLVFADDSSVRNWFDDPFFAVRSHVADCPEPLGPRTTEAEMKKQTHYRSERGTRCWLEGKCRLPSSYAYDAGIADGVRKRFDTTRAYGDASLWITVQRRIVWVEGCVTPAYRPGTIERWLQRVPDVELVVVNVRRGPKGGAPYRLATSPP